MPPAVLAEYEAVFAEPGALAAALDWYRALPGGRPGETVERKVAPPVLYVFGKRDMPVFVGPAVQAEHARFMAGPFEVIELDAGHWLMQEQTGAVVDAALRHLEARRDG
jgi:pimeloyl-ACP methyl ester carboxylesterase